MRLETKNRIAHTLSTVQQLPTLPATYTRLQKVLANPRTSAREVGAVIEQDPSLTSKLLRIVNSAYYSFPTKVSSVSKTVIILGFNEVKLLALSISVLKMFSEAQAYVGFNHVDFWRHSMGVAVCSGILAKKAGPTISISSEEAFVAGLLHDIGIIVEEQFMHERFIEVLEKQRQDGSFLCAAEKDVMGFTHEETGMYLAEAWNLPRQLQETTGFHHNPQAQTGGSTFTLVSMVHTADVVVRALGLGLAGDPFVPEYHRGCLDAIGLTVDDIEASIEEIVAVYNEMNRFLLFEET